ncbi:hypothetical protein HK102_002147 [Quaeritorhiza haematococci]|nr:hypothetical protein HK102_002147 [Quaeritorhiza haematococci]
MLTKTLSTVTASALLMAAGANGQGSWCNSDKSYCVSATVSGSNITVVMSTSVSGWVAMGVGSGMADADVVVGWANGNSTVVTDRTASGYRRPSLDITQVSTAVAPPSNFTAPTGHNLVVAFTRPLAASAPNKEITPGKQQSFMWSMNTAAPADPTNPNSTFTKHTAQGTYTCDFAAVNCTGGNNNTTGNGTKTGNHATPVVYVGSMGKAVTAIVAAASAWLLCMI